MKKFSYVIVLAMLMIACSGKSNKGMLVQGKVKGLTKGTLFLQKMADSTLVDLDSISLFGKEDFQLSAAVESPELFYLTLGKKSIPFFGEEGTIDINTKLDKFIVGAEIKGSTNQELLDEYNKVKQRFNDRQLDNIVAKYKAEQSKDEATLKKIAEKDKRHVRRKYLYAINFAIANADKEIAPYIALTELFNAQTKWLDSINSSLTPSVKASRYGKQLEKFITDVKKLETK